MPKIEYDWDAMAARIERGMTPRPLPEMLKALYELGYEHGAGWCGSPSDPIEQAAAAVRATDVQSEDHDP
jgi:hypothetical protein